MQDNFEYDKNASSAVVVPIGSLEGKERAEARSVPTPSGGQGAGTEDRWRGYSGGVSLGMPLDPDSAAGSIVGKTLTGLSNIISTVELSLEIVKTIGTIINAFQSDVNSLFTALNVAIKAILKSLEEIAVSLSSTGVYGLLVTPSISPFSPDSPSGGFPEFKAKVNHALTNKSDPNRPVFYEGDYIGGVVIALVGASNIGDLLKDLQVLSKFFKNESQKLSPVANLTATPGLFYKSEMPSFGGSVGGFLTSSIFGVKEPAIKITWSSPKGIPIEGYRVYRSKTLEGEYPEEDKKVSADSWVNANKPLRVYRDFAFNNGNPILIKGSKENMSYTDFEVINGEMYFYKVAPLLKDKNGEYVEDETIGGFTSARATSCVPESYAESSYETPDGLLQGVATGDPPYWSNISLRGLIGESLDAILNGLSDISLRFEAVAVSNSQHYSTFLDALERWVKKIAEFLEKLKAILDSLRALQLSGSAMVLTIPVERGGVEGFRRRFNAARLPSAISLGGGATASGAFDEEAPNPFQGNLCSVCAGAVLLTGAITLESLDRLGGASKDEVSKIKRAGQFERAKKAYDVARRKELDNGLIGDTLETSTKYAQKTLEFLTSLVSGGS